MYKRITDILEEAVKNHPDKIALMNTMQSVTYEEMRDRALEIAGIIEKTGIENCAVVIALPRCIAAFEVMFAIAYSWNYWIWLDTSLPDNRQREILKQLGEYVIVTDITLSSMLSRDKTIYIDSTQYKATVKSDPKNTYIRRMNSCMSVDKMAVLFTSGSSGISKGVVLTHEGMLRHMDAERFLSKKYMNNVISLFSPYSICTISFFFSTMLVGGIFFVLPNDCFLKPNLIKDIIVTKQVKTLVCPPSAIKLIAGYGFLEDLVSLETIILAGSKMSPELGRKILNCFPKVTLMSVYGATEIYGPAFYEIVDRNIVADISIGRPYPNVEYRITDESGDHITDKGKGELLISTKFMAEGYLGQTAETERVFCFDPENKRNIYKTGDIVSKVNDMLYFVGRKDNQIKNLEYRVELEDIDSTAERVEGVDTAVTIYDEEKESIILLYNGSVSETDLQKEMVKSLPSYMRPSRCVYVTDILYNENGKIDRIKIKNMVSKIY